MRRMFRTVPTNYCDKPDVDRTNFIAHFRSPELKLTEKPLKKHTILPLNKFQNIFKDVYGPLSLESETSFGVPIGLRGAEWEPSPFCDRSPSVDYTTVSYTHLRAHETDSYLVC